MSWHTSSSWRCKGSIEAIRSLSCDTDGAYTAGYRFGFNGEQKDVEIKGTGNSSEFRFRGYDSRLGRFTSIDPLHTDYPLNSPYAFAENDVISAIDLEGAERLRVTEVNMTARTATLTIRKDVEIIRERTATTYLDAGVSAKVHNRFEQGNTNVFTREIPTNGKPVEYISEERFNAGEGFEISAVYDVNVRVSSSADKTAGPDGLTSRVATGSPFSSIRNSDGSVIPGSSRGASSSLGTEYIQTVTLNPAFTGGLVEGYSEIDLLTHEVGCHNMSQREHMIGPEGPIYPGTGALQLDSNTLGEVVPSLQDTQRIIDVNTRQNRIDG